MYSKTEQIIRMFQTMIERDLSVLEFWQNFDQADENSAFSIDDIAANIPETLASEEDLEKLKEIALETMSFCQKKKALLEKISTELKDFDGI